MKKNTVVFGLLFGILSPIFGFFLVEALFDLYAEYKGEYGDWRLRTLAVIALCFNLIPFHLFKSQHFDQALRGVVLPTIVYVFLWVFYFWAEIFPG